MRHRVESSKTRPGHGASHRDAPQPGDGAAPPRADRDDGAEGEGAAAVRRADHHDRQARPRRRRGERQGAARAPAGAARHPGPRRRRQAVRHDRAALRGAAGRLHADPARSATAAATAPRSRRSSWSAASTIPNAETEKTEARRRPKPKGVGGRLRAAAERLRGKKAEGAEAAERQPTNKAKPKRQLKSDKGGRAATKRQGRQRPRRPQRKAGCRRR